jgi:hypothetical protein
MELKDWMEYGELMQFLGYSDPRSVEKWCRKNSLEITKVGLKKYVSSQKLTQILDNQLVIFEKENKSAELEPSYFKQEPKSAPDTHSNMNQMTNLKLPKKLRPKGLFLFCNRCDKEYSDDRKVKCTCGCMVYKAKIHVAGTKHGLRKKTLEATNFKDALKEFLDFKEGLEANSYQRIEIKKTIIAPTLLNDCQETYINFLNNVGVPKHKQKKREQKHINEVVRTFGQFNTGLAENGIDCRILKFTDVNDEMVGFFHEHLLETLKLENKTYNNKIALLSAFTTHIISKFKFDYENPFLGVPDRVVNVRNESVRENEFEKLLEIVTPENGVQMKIIKTLKNPKKVSMYRPWLKVAYKFGLFTGGRSEDIVLPKWTDVLVSPEGAFDTIKVIDHKIDSANSHLTSEKDRIYKYFPITKELGDLLKEMGYEQYKGTDKYIIAPEENVSRSFVSKLISESFSHYYKQLDTGKQVSFKHLRKAYHTAALQEYGEASTALTGHTTVNMTIKRYQDQQVTRDDAKENFSVFGKNKAK